MKRSVVRRVSHTFLLSLCICMLTATTAYATGGDPLTIVNNLSDFIFPSSRPSASLFSAGVSCRWA